MDLFTTSLGFCQEVEKLPSYSITYWRPKKTNLCFWKILIRNCR